MTIYEAAAAGNDEAVRNLLTADPSSATSKGGPNNWDALTYLCFSSELRSDPARGDAFVRAAQALLDAGADPNTGYFDESHRPDPQFESVLYGAAGVAHHAGLTRLLVERGANPNDDEVPYHSPETYDNGALEVLVESGKLTADSLTTMLVRKHDWHDYEGVKYLLDHGADPNPQTRWGRTPFQHALLRDNSLKIIELLLDRGADPARGIGLAARRGRGDVLDLLERRGISVQADGVDRLLAACAQNQASKVRAIQAASPELVAELAAQGGKPLAQFAGNDNSEGVRLLLESGVPVDAPFTDSDGYWDIAKDSTALHVAAWRGSHATVKLLIERGAAVNARDGKNRTPLALAVKACVNSYWTWRRKPDSVAALLAAGASAEGIAYPCGYAEVDELLAGAIG